MNKVAQWIGWIVIIFLAFIFLFGFISPNREWATKIDDNSMLCNQNKGWFEWPNESKEKCINLLELNK